MDLRLDFLKRVKLLMVLSEVRAADSPERVYALRPIKKAIEFSDDEIEQLIISEHNGMPVSFERVWECPNCQERQFRKRFGRWHVCMKCGHRAEQCPDPAMCSTTVSLDTNQARWLLRGLRDWKPNLGIDDNWYDDMVDELDKATEVREPKTDFKRRK